MDLQMNVTEMRVKPHLLNKEKYYHVIYNESNIALGFMASAEHTIDSLRRCHVFAIIYQITDLN